MNTYQFEEVRDQESGALLWVGAREQESPWRFFVWVANTGTWHRYQEFEPGAGWVDGVDFKEIDAVAVPALVESVRRVDERRFGWVMDEFRAQPSEEILTNAQLGLDAGQGARPTRTVALEEIPTDGWMTLKTYGPDGEGKARSLASDIRLGKRKGWPAGAVRANTKSVTDGFEVQISREKGYGDQQDRGVIRVGVVSPSEILGIGLAGAAARYKRVLDEPAATFGFFHTVSELFSNGENAFDVVVLDAPLADGSKTRETVRRLVASGYPVLVFSIPDGLDDLREALAAGAAGVAYKTDDVRLTLDLIRKVASGETIENRELADAIDMDTEFVKAQLSERERTTLQLYSDGLSRSEVASRLHVSDSTVRAHIRRSREKFVAAAARSLG